MMLVDRTFVCLIRLDVESSSILLLTRETNRKVRRLRIEIIQEKSERYSMRAQ